MLSSFQGVEKPRENWLIGPSREVCHVAATTAPHLGKTPAASDLLQGDRVGGASREEGKSSRLPGTTAPSALSRPASSIVGAALQNLHLTCAEAGQSQQCNRRDRLGIGFSG